MPDTKKDNIMSSNSIPDSNPRLPRGTKTSPRTNAFNEIITIIDAKLPLYQQSGNFEYVNALRDMRTEVAAKIGTPHIVRTPRTKKENKEPEVGGTYFVGETEFGVAIAVKKVGNDYFTIDGKSDTENKALLRTVFGPFRTFDGSLYSATHGTYKNRPQVF